MAELLANGLTRLSYTPAALRTALEDCLELGAAAYWEAAASRYRASTHVVPSRNSPQRLALLAETVCRLNGGGVCAVDEQSDDDCWLTLERLSFTGKVSSEGYWTGPNQRTRFTQSDPVLEMVGEDGPTPELRLASALESALDAGLSVTIWSTGTRCGVELELCQSFGDCLVKPSIRSFSDEPDIPLNLRDRGPGQFLALDARGSLASALRVPNRWYRIQQVLARLRELEGPACALDSLGTPDELQLLARVESFPFLPRSEPARLCQWLRQTASEALPWLEVCHTPAQRALARGLRTLMEQALRLLGLQETGS